MSACKKADNFRSQESITRANLGKLARVANKSAESYAKLAPKIRSEKDRLISNAELREQHISECATCLGVTA